MTEDPADDLEMLRQELARLGLSGGAKPDDFGLEFRSAESFVEPSAEAEPHFRRRLPRWVPPALIAAAAAILAVAILVPEISGDSSDPRSPGATITPDILTVANVLHQAADASAQLPDMSAARFWRVESFQQQGSRPREKRTTWYGHHEPGLIIDEFGRTDLLPATFGLQTRALTWDELVALPTAPSALRAVLDREAKGLPDPHHFIVKMAADLLAESPAPPELRRALWQVIAGVPGVVSEGNVEDALGRRGVGLVLDLPGRAKLAYIIDPAHGRILESTVTSSIANTDVYRSIYLDQRAVDELP